MQNNVGNVASMPASMKDITFKQIIKLIETLRRENNADYQVVLLTATGTIVGELAPCSAENEMIKYADDPTKFNLDISSIFDSMKSEFNAIENSEHVYSDAYLLNVTNATVYKTGTNDELMRLNQMIVFTDQIIGFTLVTKSDWNEHFTNLRSKRF